MNLEFLEKMKVKILEENDMRTIIITVKIDDNDVIEHNLYKLMQSVLGTSFKDFKILPNTKELYQNDKVFKKMVIDSKKQRRLIDDYVLKFKK